jgi:hypothetical protein
MMTNEIKLFIRALIDGHSAMAKLLEGALREMEHIERGQKAPGAMQAPQKFKGGANHASLK